MPIVSERKWPFSLKCWEIETSSSARKKISLQWKGNATWAVQPAVLGNTEATELEGGFFFFLKGRKENEGMQGLSGRGSLLLLGHESDSSSLVTAALWLFTSLYRVITFYCTWRPNSITELNLWHNWSQRWVTKQAAQFQKTFLWGFTGTSLSCAQGTVVRFDFSLPWKGGCAKFLMFQ